MNIQQQQQRKRKKKKKQERSVVRILKSERSNTKTTYIYI